MTNNKKDKNIHPTRAQFQIDWRNLTYCRSQTASLLDKCLNINASLSSSKTNHSPKQPKTKRILNSLDGCFKSGELTAILGPSGAGKSTFLDCLFGKRQDGATGSTKVTWLDELNIINSSNRPKQRSLNVAMVPQDDHLFKSLTVYETLFFASKIKNNNQQVENTSLFHQKNVYRVAKLLKLVDCFGTKCNKLSGGQRKRVSIGQELLSEPDVIVLDEPTSGLDSMTCLSTIKCLKSIVVKQKISIVLTIHQPDIDVFNLFDKVYVIAQGGMAIYEGRPQDLASRMTQVGLSIPSYYNPARFIVEKAFCPVDSSLASDFDTSSSDDDEDYDKNFYCVINKETKKLHNSTTSLKKSVLNLADSLVNLADKHLLGKNSNDSINKRQPLLNLAVKTTDGQLITSEDINCHKYSRSSSSSSASTSSSSSTSNNLNKKQRTILRTLNEIQKSFYKENAVKQQLQLEPTSMSVVKGLGGCFAAENSSSSCQSDFYCSLEESFHSNTATVSAAAVTASTKTISTETPRATNDYDDNDDENGASRRQSHQELSKDRPVKQSLGDEEGLSERSGSVSIEFADNNCNSSPTIMMATIDNNSPTLTLQTNTNTDIGDENFAINDDINKYNEDKNHNIPSNNKKLDRSFDKGLSAKVNFKKRKHPTWKHAMILTHRTWLCIIRDPVFFGIQLAMHLMIPLVLASLFGQVHDETCPNLEKFDIVEYAYADHNSVKQSVESIRHSMSNLGIVFFHLFVLCFAINCVTALVFPLDMHILAKEFSNGWYNPTSYMIARSLADLPIPVFMHSGSFAILYYLTGQANSFLEWRFLSITGLMILASIVAQSIGLTTGAILMKSQQSAVLTAAALTAPTFALSGYLVRIYTLSLPIKLISWCCSYLHHLLNGFIILRYGFDKCECKDENFEQTNIGHALPKHLATVASMWIGTFASEYPNSPVVKAMPKGDYEPEDPNIDVMAKIEDVFSIVGTFGHKMTNCTEVRPYAMLDFQLQDSDLWISVASLICMVFVTKFIAFMVIYKKAIAQV